METISKETEDAIYEEEKVNEWTKPDPTETMSADHEKAENMPPKVGSKEAKKETVTDDKVARADGDKIRKSDHEKYYADGKASLTVVEVKYKLEEPCEPLEIQNKTDLSETTCMGDGDDQKITINPNKCDGNPSEEDQTGQGNDIEKITHHDPAKIAIGDTVAENIQREEEHTRRNMDIDTGNGISIHFSSTELLQENLKFASVPWSMQERNEFIDNKMLPAPYKLLTGIYHIELDEKSDPFDLPFIKEDEITIKYNINADPSRSHYAYIRFENSWRLVEATNHTGALTFHANQMDAFCIGSLRKETKHKLSTSGLEFVSKEDERIKATFLPDSDLKERIINFEILQTDVTRIQMTESTSSEGTNDILVGISPCLFVKSCTDENLVFSKGVKIQLPVLVAKQVILESMEYEYKVAELKDESVFLTDTEVHIADGIASFEANSFSGKIVAALRKANRSKYEYTVPGLIKQALVLWVRCRFLLFVRSTSVNGLLLHVECVEESKIKNVCRERKDWGYHFVEEWISKSKLLKQR